MAGCADEFLAGRWKLSSAPLKHHPFPALQAFRSTSSPSGQTVPRRPVDFLPSLRPLGWSGGGGTAPATAVGVMGGLMRHRGGGGGGGS